MSTDTATIDTAGWGPLVEPIHGLDDTIRIETAELSGTLRPTMSAFDEFLPVRSPDGARGFAMVEHGQVRRVF